VEKDNDKQNKFEKVLLKIAVIIGALGVIIGGIITGITYTYTHATPELVKAILAVLNLIALITYCYFSTKVPKLELNKDDESKRQYCKLLNIKSNDEPHNSISEAAVKAQRVNLLVGQLYTNVIWYAIFLIIVYLLYLFDNKWLFDEYLFPTKGYHKYIHSYFNIVIGVCNYLSAVFLFLGFKVLYDKTISDNNTPLRYYNKAIVLSTLFLCAYIIFSVSVVTTSFENADLSASNSISAVKEIINSYQGSINTSASETLNEINKISSSSLADANRPAPDSINEVDKTITSYKKLINASASDSINTIKEKIALHENKTSLIVQNLFQLFIGIFNGLAMALLFGRYISMEHSAFNMKEGIYKKGKYNNIIHLCTIYILPIYALAQPLFGSFDIDAFGNPHTFANGVFFVCVLGKALFLYLTYLFMKQKLMHLYLHSVITSHGIPKELVKCFKANS
jgi:hypothetical protein